MRTPQHLCSRAFRPFQRDGRSQGHAHTKQVQTVHARKPLPLPMPLYDTKLAAVQLTVQRNRAHSR